MFPPPLAGALAPPSSGQPSSPPWNWHPSGTRSRHQAPPGRPHTPLPPLQCLPHPTLQAAASATRLLESLGGCTSGCAQLPSASRWFPADGSHPGCAQLPRQERTCCWAPHHLANREAAARHAAQQRCPCACVPAAGSHLAEEILGVCLVLQLHAWCVTQVACPAWRQTLLPERRRKRCRWTGLCKGSEEGLCFDAAPRKATRA